nr:uncharacterized protein LOC124816291 [Hydra vulgaris]
MEQFKSGFKGTGIFSFNKDAIDTRLFNRCFMLLEKKTTFSTNHLKKSCSMPNLHSICVNDAPISTSASASSLPISTSTSSIKDFFFKQLHSKCVETTHPLRSARALRFRYGEKLSEVQKAVEFISKSYDKIIIELTELKKTKSKKSPDESNIENGTNNIKEKIAELEDRSRRNNLRFIGIKDKANETWEESEQKIKDFLNTKLNIQEKILIDRVHRVGKENGKNRSIIVRFQNYKDKALVLNKYTTMKLWNERLYVNEDFSDFTMDLRRKLFKEAKELRAKGLKQFY